MAAHLMYIKTRMLLNLEDEEAQSEMDALIKSLEERQRGDIYARVKVLTARLAPMSEFGRDILTRPPEVMERGKIYEYRHQPGALVLALAEIQHRTVEPLFEGFTAEEQLRLQEYLARMDANIQRQLKKE